MAEPERTHQLIVIGASAGGIEALTVLLSSLPSDFRARLVVAQHLDPRRPSNLAAVLEHRSRLPVRLVEKRTEMKPGTVYVVPSNQHVLIADGCVDIEGDHGNRPRPSVDLLLSSAAMSYGEELIAVILTGAGTDGAAGAVDVKAAGGTVIIQNPETARYPSMPLAIPPTAVDHVANLEQIAPLLVDMVRGVDVDLEGRAEKVDEDFKGVLARVGRNANIDFRLYKRNTLVRRVARRMTLTHTKTLGEYGQLLDSSRDELNLLLDALLIKVTEFFRDEDAFAFLRDDVLPRIVERAAAREQTIRLWSAGCSTGEEAYSLAILLSELLRQHAPANWKVKIFATDVDATAISFARRGLYPPNLLKHVPEPLLSAYFDRVELGHQVSKPIRQMVIFGQQDLSRGVPFPRIDLAVCRNLLIYFTPELQEEIMTLFAYSLSAVNGYLFLGKAETVRPSKANFELVNKRWKVYRCTSGPLQAPSRAAAIGAPLPAAGHRRGQTGDVARAGESQTDLTDLRRFNEFVLRFLPTGIALIDRSYRIVTINAAARRLLGVHDVSAESDFLHAVRGLPYGPLRAAIDAAFRERSPVTVPELQLDSTSIGETRYVTLSLSVLQLDAYLGELCVISMSDTTEVVVTRHRVEAVQQEQKQLLEELGTANKRLNDLNKDLQDANEELQAANEEMMLTQEELQATNEEFEATNEELQATNEELETNNEELQATNEELETTNEELNARTTELQFLTGALEGERRRLAEFVEMAPIHVMIARGAQLLVERVNSQFAKLLKKPAVDGRTLEDVLQEVGLMSLIDPARDAFRHDHTVAGIPVTHDGDRLLFTIAPIHDKDGAPSGLAIYAHGSPVVH